MVRRPNVRYISKIYCEIIAKYHISHASGISAQVPLHNAFIADARPVCKAPTTTPKNVTN